MKSAKVLFIFLFFFAAAKLSAQIPDSVYLPNIQTVRLYNTSSQLSLPIINLNATQQLELHFDDLDADVKYYYYTYQLCNSDWKPANLGQYDYIKGFTQSKISDYRFSSFSRTRYTHYRVLLPDQNMSIARSGNYIVKVYLNGDTSQVVFTKRFMVVDNKVGIVARVTQPLSPTSSYTHQRIEFTVDAKALQSFNAGQQIMVTVMQNYRWDNAQTDIKPTFIRGTSLEYNSENIAVFPGGKEWRWIDLRDFQLQSDRVQTANYNSNSTDIFLKPDISLSDQRYVYYQDLNGMFSEEAVRGTNPYTEADYATVNFSFLPPNGIPYPDKDIYLFGQLTNYDFIDSLKMVFDPVKKVYQTHLFLKQGYYDYSYMAVDKANPAIHHEMDGDYYETENAYTIFVYYRPFIGRADQLIGVTTIDSRSNQSGIGN